MKKSMRYLCTAAVTAGTLAAGLVWAADKAASEPSAAQMAEMMKKAEVAGTPGAPHKVLEPLAGKWTAEVKCFMSDPPTVTKGTAKANWILNGRFLQEEFHGEVMGKPFHGISLTGYDNAKQKHTTVWMDDINTSMTTSSGEASEDGKVITLEGKCDCSMTGQKDMPFKQVLRIVSADKHVFEMHDPSKGAQSKTMEITYTRDKGNLAGANNR